MKLLQFLLRLVGLAVIIFALNYATSSNEKLIAGEIVHMPSMLLIGLVLTGIALLSYQIKRLFGAFSNLFFSSSAKDEEDFEAISKNLHNLSDGYYMSGSISIVDLKIDKGSKLWSYLERQINSKIPIADIKEIISYEAKRVIDDVEGQINCLNTLGAVAPSIGILGTVLGLIKLLAELKDLDALGANMSMALVTTLYGILAGSILFKPLASRLESVRDCKMKLYNQALMWLHNVENRKPSLLLEGKKIS